MRAGSVRVAPHAALEGPRAEADDVLLALSGSSLHSEERSGEPVEQHINYVFRDVVTRNGKPVAVKLTDKAHQKKSIVFCNA